MASSIGIKIANGEFYPILSESKPVRKRMVLTTVRDGQDSLQIDLYQSATRAMADARHIGTLVVDRMLEKKKGEPSVELVISRDANGELTAVAKDLESPRDSEPIRLVVSLSAFNNKDGFDAEIDPDAPPVGISEDDNNDPFRMSYATNPNNDPPEEKQGIKLSTILIIVLLFLVAMGFCAWFFLLRSGSDTPKYEDAPVSVSPRKEKPAPVTPPPPVVPPPVVPPPPPPVVKETPPPPAPEITPPPPPAPAKKAPPVITAPPPAPAKAPESRARDIVAPVRDYVVPSVIPPEGITYRLRWGDTLWDVSDVFYRNPWRYRALARSNGIDDPDRVVSGMTIRIPPR